MMRPELTVNTNRCLRQLTGLYRLLSQACFDFDLRPAKRAGDGTALPRFFCELLKLRVVDPRSDHPNIEHDRRDGHLLADFLDGAFRVGFHTRVLCAALLERRTKGHRVTSCFGSGEKLFGIRGTAPT